MKLALIEIANTVLSHLPGRTLGLSTTPDDSQTNTRCPKFVAHTAEGRIMDGPRGLRLITPYGPTPVDATPDGFLVYYPVPHILPHTK